MPITDVIQCDNGSVQVFRTTIRGEFRFVCECKLDVVVSVRHNHHYKDQAYQFDVVHRSKARTYSSKDPDPMMVLEKIIAVCSYVRCGFPLA